MKMGSNKVKKGANDLETHNPELLGEWDYEKNGELLPAEVTYGSARKIWWKCSLGHSFLASLNSRTNNGGKCPFCSGHKVLKGFNDLLTLRPDIAGEWDYERNNPYEPTDYSVCSNKTFWWKCGKPGHIWKTTISHRTEGTGCPFCSGKKVLPEESLATLAQALMKEWDYEKNKGVNPEEISKGSQRRAWWKCTKQGHSWKAVVRSRALDGNGCPYCSGVRVLKGYNDVATVKPELVEEWNWEKNIGLDPGLFGVTSPVIVWWKCKKGHEWMSSLGNREGGNGCPYCSGKIPMRLKLV